MNLRQRFRVWLTKRWALVLFIALILLLWFMPEWLNKPTPLIVRTLGSSTQHVDVLWFRQDFAATRIAANDNEMVFAMSSTWDSLIAINAQTGATVWKAPLSLERRDTRSLLANQDTVFVVTTITVDAYDAKTGQLKWSTELGQGHVSIMSQLDADVLRVYYGDKIFELDSETGKILDTLPKGAIVWISGNTVLKGFGAFDRQTSELLWSEGYPFYLDEGIEPKDVDTNLLIIAMEPGSSFIQGICALNLHTGQHNWCRSEEFNSLIAVNPQSQLGYVMRSDVVLITLDLHSGTILGETSFLAGAPTPAEMGTYSNIVVSDGVVVVSFSDSAQTFGLKFRP